MSTENKPLLSQEKIEELAELATAEIVAKPKDASLYWAKRFLHLRNTFTAFPELLKAAENIFQFEAEGWTEPEPGDWEQLRTAIVQAGGAIPAADVSDNDEDGEPDFTLPSVQAGTPDEFLHPFAGIDNDY